MKTNRSLFLILTVILSAFIAYGLFTLPTAKNINDECFSSARVIQDLKVIAEAEVIRDYYKKHDY